MSLLRFIGAGAKVTEKLGAKTAEKGAVAAGKAAAKGAGKLAAGAAVHEGRHWLEHTAGAAFNVAFAGQQLINGLQGIIGSVTNDFTHVITVEVRGGPKATIKRIWQLAVSAAFGKYRQGVAGGGDMTLSATWDITGKAVAVQIHYTNTGLTSSLINGGPQRFSGPTAYKDFFQTGPSQELVGGDWSLWATKTKAIESNSQSNDSVLSNLLSALDQFFGNGNNLPLNPFTVPQVIIANGNLQAQFQNPNQVQDQNTVLPDDGRIILTSAKENPQVQPFTPSTDYLLALVQASLVDPCVLPVAPPTDTMAGQVPKPRLGYRVYQPGTGATANEKINGTTDQTDLTPIIVPDINIPFQDVGVGGIRANTGIDGYAQPTPSQTPSVLGAFNNPR
jgi:hypothetical protein